MNVYLLYTMLLANCPVDTRNMITHITIKYYEGYVIIEIAAPSKYGDYAKHVNYNRKRSPKEVRNYEWVERTIKQWAEITGGNIQYELY